MAVDTRNRRAGAHQFLRPRIGTMPNPDGLLVSVADRAQMLGLYPGMVPSAEWLLILEDAQLFQPGVDTAQLFQPGVDTAEVLP